MPEEDTEETEIEVSDSETEEETEEAEDDYVPPTKEDFVKMQAALQKANKEATRNRLALKELREKAEEGNSETEVEKARKAAEASWKPRVVKSAAKAALLSAGAGKPERLLKLVDVDKCDVDEDGDVAGLDDQIDELREEYPELFEAKTTKRTRVETGDRTAKPRTKSATELQAAALLGGN